MNGKWKALSIITFAVLMLAIPLVQATEPAVPHNADAMWIEPATVDLTGTSAGVGYMFNVTVWINLTKTSSTWQFVLAYNSNHLNATRCGYTGPSGTKSDFFSGLATLPLTPTFGVYNTTHNSILFGELWGMAGPYRDPGHGSLAWVEFNVTAVPASGQTFTSMIGLTDVYPDGGGDTYAQQPDSTKIAVTSDYTTYTIPEFSGLAIVALLMCMVTITILARKLTWPSRR
jgi:hypothetical protein